MCKKTVSQFSLIGGWGLWVEEAREAENGCMPWKQWLRPMGGEGTGLKGLDGGERGELRAAGWASILPGLGEGRRQPYGLWRLWEPPPTPTTAWLVLKGKAWGSVEWPDSVEKPLFPASKSVALILSSLGRGGSKCMSVWLADQGSPVFLMSLLEIQGCKLEAQSL